MKNLIFILILVPFLGKAQPVSIPPKMILSDDCETVYTYSWPTPKNEGYYYFSGADCPSQSTITRVSSGQFGAPAPRNGTYCYKMKVVKDPSRYGTLSCTRSEVYWGDGVDPTPYDHKWTAYSTLIPASWCDEKRPTGIGMDHKKISTAGSPNFRLEAFNGNYRVVTNFGNGENTYDLGPITKGVWVDWVYYNNYKTGSEGILRFYKDGALVLNLTGQTVFDFEGGSTTRESYMLHGIYKWVWDKADGQGWGAGTCNDSAVMYIDRIRFGTSAASLADFVVEDGPGGNISPTSSAGADQTITLPDTDVALVGSGSDPDGTIASYAWTKVSGTGGTITSPTTASTTVTGLTEGTYVFRLTVTDDEGATAVDELTVIVQSSTPPANDDPIITDVTGTAASTPNSTVLLPVTADTLAFYAKDQDAGYIVQMLVTQLTGPNTSTINYLVQDGYPTTTLSYSISGLVAGTYTYKLSAEDNSGGIVLDTISVFVIAESNDPPTANAGVDKILTLNEGSGATSVTTTLTGVPADPDGSVASVIWAKIGGPDGSSFGSPATNTTTFSALVGGTYKVRFTVTDNSGATAFDEANVTVLACDAGSDATITLPTSSYTLTGSCINVSDTTNVLWTQITSGAATIAQDGQLSTSVTGLQSGTYIFELAVTYSTGQTVRSRMQLVVSNGTSGTYLFQKGSNPARQ